uniref:Uncharacterized protein n=1 Tax=Salvator merianae TaxID=96440 RepID=A0A8D0E9Q9_SALMN
MIAATKPWPVMITTILCILFCLGTLVDAYPVKPELTEDDASADAMDIPFDSLYLTITVISSQRLVFRYLWCTDLIVP